MKILFLPTLVSLIIISAVSCTSVSRKTQGLETAKMLEYCVLKTSASMKTQSSFDSVPRNILPGQTKWNTVNIHDWTSGFWSGVLWNAYEASGDTAILLHAQKSTVTQYGVLSVPVENHDLGFMLYCSYGNGFRLTKDSAYHQVLLKAADSLATLYNPKVGTILSWPNMRSTMNWPHNTIIDNLINLELLFWASKNGGNQKYYDMAVKHAEICMHTLIRPDFTTFHVAVFDTIDGHFIKGVTHQGYSDNSMWARGQAWGIYGYTMCYRETGKPEFLETARKLADVFIKRLPKDGIPYWDFDDPMIPDSPKDASAAAVAASGILELSGLVKDASASMGYKNAAKSLLANLSTPEYLSNEKNQAFLLHSTGHKPNGTEIDASIIYADYYYLEALLRLRKMEQ
ncbi:MAG: glycoside hydrolase family 88 protein [Prolixibacteraceae bacterium]